MGGGVIQYSGLTFHETGLEGACYSNMEYEVETEVDLASCDHR